MSKNKISKIFETFIYNNTYLSLYLISLSPAEDLRHFLSLFLRQS